MALAIPRAESVPLGDANSEQCTTPVAAGSDAEAQAAAPNREAAASTTMARRECEGRFRLTIIRGRRRREQWDSELTSGPALRVIASGPPGSPFANRSDAGSRYRADGSRR